LDDHIVRPLVATGLVTLSWGTPWAAWLAAFAGTTFTTTVWVINRVHCDTAHRGTNTAPTYSTGFTDLTQAVFFVTDLTDRRAALNVNATNFT
jgi:hypothetical protein